MFSEAKVIEIYCLADDLCPYSAHESIHSFLYNCCVKTGKVTNNKISPRNIHRKNSFFRSSFFILYPMLGFATIRISYHETSPDNEVQLQKKLSL